MSGDEEDAPEDTTEEGKHMHRKKFKLPWCVNTDLTACARKRGVVRSSVDNHRLALRRRAHVDICVMRAVALRCKCIDELVEQILTKITTDGYIDDESRSGKEVDAPRIERCHLRREGCIALASAWLGDLECSHKEFVYMTSEAIESLNPKEHGSYDEGHGGEYHERREPGSFPGPAAPNCCNFHASSL